MTVSLLAGLPALPTVALPFGYPRRDAGQNFRSFESVVVAGMIIALGKTYAAPSRGLRSLQG